MTTNLTVKKASSITKRSLDSFRMFQSKEFVSGYQNLVTIQPLNKSKTRGWFIRKSDLDTCNWTAKETDFDKGSVLWDYKQTFGLAPNTSIEEGLNFIVPRLQILLRSPLMVEETGGMRQTIGTFEDPEVKELFEADKIADNANELVQTLIKLKPTASKGTYIKSIFMSSTMSPSVAVDVKSVS